MIGVQMGNVAEGGGGKDNGYRDREIAWNEVIWPKQVKERA